MQTITNKKIEVRKTNKTTILSNKEKNIIAIMCMCMC